jgi:DNA-binding transcriptional MerR regulator
MRVGEISEQTGVSVRAIRYYEHAGLLSAVRRANGYREFDASAVERVRAIRDLLDVGFTIEEIVSLSPCLAGADSVPCRTQTAALYRDKLDRVNQQVSTLLQLRERIQERIAVLEPARPAA